MAASDLHCIVYVSAAKGLFTREELEALLATSRANNAADHITGCLLYSEGSIMQVLEGPADAVRATFGRIRRDITHTQIIKILDAPITVREFPEWSMAFDRPTADDFFRLRQAFEAETGTPSLAFGLLKQFWSNQR